MENFKYFEGPKNITTGPHPSSPGACQAHFNHQTYRHFHKQTHQPTYPNPHYTNGYMYPEIPTGRPPFGYYPYQYY